MHHVGQLPALDRAGQVALVVARLLLLLLRVLLVGLLLVALLALVLLLLAERLVGLALADDPLFLGFSQDVERVSQRLEELVVGDYISFAREVVLEAVMENLK